MRSLMCAMLDIPYSTRMKVFAMLEEDLHAPSYMEMLVRMNVYKKGPYYTACPAAAHADNIAQIIASNAMFVTEIGNDFYPAGSWIEVELCCGAEDIPIKRRLCHYCNYCGRCLRR